MSQGLETPAKTFTDRRSRDYDIDTSGRERRQFADGRDDLSPPAKELARDIDEYKLHHRRRFITYEEMFNVITSLGYHK